MLNIEEQLLDYSITAAKNIADGEHNGFIRNDCYLVKLMLANISLIANKHKRVLNCRQLHNLDKITKSLIYGR